MHQARGILDEQRVRAACLDRQRALEPALARELWLAAVGESISRGIQVTTRDRLDSIASAIRSRCPV